jgi:uncharacterized protein (DUF885 family)
MALTHPHTAWYTSLPGREVSLGLALLLALPISSTPAGGAEEAGEASQPLDPGLVAAEQEAAAALDSLAEERWQQMLAESLPLRIRHGLPPGDLPDLSWEEAERRARAAEEMLGRLAGIDPELLDDQRWLSHRVLEWEARQTVEGIPWFWHRFQVTPYTWSFTGILQTFAALPLATPAQGEEYLRLLGQVPAVARQLLANLETQRQRGIVLPRPAVDLAVATFRGLAREPGESPFGPAPGRLAALEPDEAQVLLGQAAGLLRDRVNPALEEVAAYLEGAYREGAPATVGLDQYPGGAEAYRYVVRLHTTLDVTPEEVHRLGLAEVEHIAGEMEALRRELGSPEPSLAAWHQRLRRDPRFLACTPEEVGDRLAAPLARIEPLVDGWFALQPEAPYGLERLPAALEGAMTFGYYQWPTPENPVGRYLYNASQLPERPQVFAAALVYHELVPGHHFQIALQQENEALPAFRRNSFHTAFTEGWAEYASELAGEMGLYAEPYDRYGRLAMDMFLSTRLVVDTGMHALGWSREQAAAFMGDHILESETQIATETLRYATDLPAQALAYKMGSRHIAELRRRAEAALGERFDVRRFHDAVLGSGSLPLAVLEAHIERWIAAEAGAGAGSS